jgi:hypothetical protein
MPKSFFTCSTENGGFQPDNVCMVAKRGVLFAPVAPGSGPEWQ